MRLLNLFGRSANRDTGNLSLKDVKDSIGHYAQEQRRACSPNSLAYIFYDKVADFFGANEVPTDPKNEALETVALRAIRMSGKSPTLSAIIDYAEQDDHLNDIMDDAEVTLADLETYIKENHDWLVNDNYLVRGGLYEPVAIQLTL